MRYLLCLLVGSMAYGQTDVAGPLTVYGNGLDIGSIINQRYEIRDKNNGATKWFLQADLGHPTLGTTRLWFEDTTSTKIVQFERRNAGAITNRATLDMHWIPAADAAYTLGNVSERWLSSHIVDSYVTRIRPITGSDVLVAADLVSSTGGELGTSATRWPKLWVTDIDCSGVCPGASYWTRTGTNLSPTTAGDDVTSTTGFKSVNGGGTAYVAGNKVEVHSSTSGAHFDFIHVSPNFLQLRAPDGFTIVQQWDVTGVGRFYSRLLGDWQPMSSATWDLGLNANRWRDAWLSRNMEVGGNLTVIGTCTGCGSGGFPTTDTAGIFTGSSDATKHFRFEVDTLVTSGATRIATVPNTDFRLAAQDLDNVFSTQQTSNIGFKSAIAGNTGFMAGNKIEIHNATSGQHFDFRSTATNTAVMLAPDGVTQVMFYDVSLSPAYVQTHGDFRPDADASAELGKSALKWKNIYFSDNLFQGTVQRISSLGTFATGNVVPTVSATYGVGNSGLQYDEGHFINTYMTNLKPMAGTGNKITQYAHIVPTIATTWNIGDPSHQLGVLYASEFRGSNVFATAFAPSSGSAIVMYADFIPDTNNLRELGTSGQRFKKQYLVDLDVSGTCTGCGAGYFTAAFGTTYLNNGDNVYFGLAGGGTTAYKVDIVGSLRVQANLDVTGIVLGTGGFQAGFGTPVIDASAQWVGHAITFPADATYSIGSTFVRTNELHVLSVQAGTGMFINNPSSPTTTWHSFSSGGITIRNTGTLATTFSVAPSTGSVFTAGRVSAVQGYIANGSTGISTTTGAGCVFVLGILTGGC